jgi:D-alanine-D-alanine ligase
VVGLVYETFDTYAHSPDGPDDQHAEYEPIATVEALEEAIHALGHRPKRLGAPHELLVEAASGALDRIDAAMNIAEGYGSRNREGWAPSILELAGVPQLGSDALTLSLSLDKFWTNRMLGAAGIRVPANRLMQSAEEAESVSLPAEFPLFVKPRWEGTAKGIVASSRVEDRAGLAREVERVVSSYAQPALVEAFVPGAEYTVCVVGHDPPRALPVLQRALEQETRIGLHALEGSAVPAGGALAHCVPGELTAELERSLQETALRVHAELECRDFSRSDFRLDASGRPVFLEVNPLPTFAPDGTFAILAELEGRPFAELLAEVLGDGLRRLGLAQTHAPVVASE